MGAASTKANDNSRLTAVEREILRCAALGETADFTGRKWARVRKVDGRPVVAAKFLADLWLGLHDVRVHPVGLILKGLHVSGSLELGGARIDARMRSPLVGFNAQDCRFEGCFSFANARLEALFFEDCEFAASDMQRTSIAGMSAEVIGQVILTRCTVEGYTLLRNAVIDDDLSINGGSFGRAISIVGAEVRGNLSFVRACIDGLKDPAGIALDAYDAVVAGNVDIRWCRIDGAIGASQISAASVTIRKTRLRGAGAILNAAFAKVGHSLRIERCTLAAGADLSAATIGGQLYCVRTRFGTSASQAACFRLMSARVKLSVLIDNCRIHGGLSASALDAGQILRLHSVAIPGTSPNFVMADFLRLTVALAELQDIFIGGQLRIDNGTLARIAIQDCVIDMAGRDRPGAAPSDAEVLAYGLSLYGTRVERDVIITGSSHRTGCLIDGGITLQALEVGGQLVLRNCWLGREHMQHSCHAWGLRAGLVELHRCVMPAGFYGANVVTSDLRIKSSICCAPEAGPGQTVAVSLQGANVSDSVFIGSDGGTTDPACQLTGSLVLTDAEVAKTLSIAGLEMILPESRSPPDWAGGATFASARLGDVFLGDDNGTGCNTALAGCIAFDRATVRSLSLFGSLIITPRQQGTVSMFAGMNADDSGRRKWGVALSLLGATIERGVRLGKARIGGMVDFKNATVNVLLDRGGRGWRDTGLAPGQLRLDGLTYSDLDDDEELATTPAGSTTHPSGAVARRLQWLALQYPGGKPDAANFTPQPYEQLASHYSSLGNESARRKVLVRKRQLQRLHTGLGPLERAVSGLLGLTSDYGYSPARASCASALLIALGTMAAAWLFHLGAIVPAEAGTPRPFSALLYAIDVAVPFLDLGHGNAWQIDPEQLAPFPGRALAVYLGETLYRLAGVVMLSITVLTFSGILHEKS